MKKKKIISFFLVFTFLFICTQAVFAEPEKYAELTKDIEYSKHITKADGAKYLDADEYFETTDFDEPDVSHAKAAILMDRDSGRVLFAKNAKKKMYPASTTKIMTAVLAMELCVEKGYDMNTVIEAKPEAILPITSDDSHMGILIGEKLSVENLLYGLLVYSANDAANVLAVELGGSLKNYVGLMNERAGQLGMSGTHFENVCGIHNDNHYTTAYDMAILAEYAMQNKTFEEIVKTPMYNMGATNKYKTERNLSNTNLFLSTYRSSYYKDTDHYVGIKTGHTSDAGYCLVTAAQHTPDDDKGETVKLLSVVMGCDDTDVCEGAYSYITTQNLINYGFNNFKYTTIYRAGDHVLDSDVFNAKNGTKVAASINDDIYALLPKNITAETVEAKTDITKNLSAPIKKGDEIGTIKFVFEDRTIAETKLVAMNDVGLSIILYVYHKIQAFVTNPIVITIFILLLLAFLAIRIIRKSNERKRRQRRLRGIQNKKRMENNKNTRMHIRENISTQQNSSSLYNIKRDGDR